MSLLSIVLSFAAATLLLAGGYLLGVRIGSLARERLRDVVQQQRLALQMARQEIGRKIDARESGLRATIEQALAPLLSRGQLSIDLASLKTGEGARDLTLLLDRIAGAGNFTTVALSDAEGLPLAGNSGAAHLDRLAVNASFMLMMADRVAATGSPAPISILMRDGADGETLCRIFYVQGQRISLIAVASGSQLTPTSLDPALAKVAGMLAQS